MISPGDMVVLLAPEPLTLTSKWDPHWQVTRVSGTTIFLRHQQSGKTKKVHRSKVKLVNPDMVWEEVAPRPHRKQQRGGPREVTVNIQVDTPQAIIPPCGDPLSMGNPQSTQEPQLSVPDESLDMDTDTPVEHPSTCTDPTSTPVVPPEVGNGLAHSEQIRTRSCTRESERGSRRSYKREHSPPETIPHRYHTRWSNLSEEDKRRKRVRYNVLAGRVHATHITDGAFTVPETGDIH